jgi:hypothetical protein
MAQEEIIEKRASSPIATSCLVISALALVGGIAFQIAEVSEVRAGLPRAAREQENPASYIWRQDGKKESEQVDTILSTYTKDDETKPNFKEAEEEVERQKAAEKGAASSKAGSSRSEAAEPKEEPAPEESKAEEPKGGEESKE